LTAHCRAPFYACSVLLCTVLFAAPSAHGQPASAAAKAAAQTLFDDARKLTAENNYAAACPKLAESHTLDPTVGTKFYLADCLERIGKLASAWTFYIEAADAAAAAGQKQRASFARDRAEAVKQRLPTITITVPDSVRALPGLSLRRNGVPLGQAQWGTAVPVDPGEHVISATAEGVAPWESRVQIKEEQEHITVDVPSLTARQGAEPIAPKPTETQPDQAPAPPVQGRGKTQRIAAIAVGATGIAGIGLGAVFGGLAVSKQTASNSDGHCDASNFCDETGLSLRRQAITSATISTVGFVAGGALVAGGVVLFLTAPSGPPSNVSTGGSSIGPAIAVGPAGLSITGTW
jgi:hypothetical protein